MPKTHNRRSHRSIWRRRISRSDYTLVHFAMMIIVFGLIITWWLNTTTNAAFPQTRQYSVLGQPSISADFIKRVLDFYHSPAAGKGQALHDYGVKYGIDPWDSGNVQA